MTTQTQPLLTPINLGPYQLPNRMVMAPLTRMRAQMPGNIPWQLNAQYYGQRASAGLIVSEATPVSPFGHGYFHTPGIHTDEQEIGWRRVTEAVHQAKGKIFLQLWHVGRQSHTDLQPGGVAPVAPSAIASPGQSPVAPGVVKNHSMPRALETDEIPKVVEEYRTGAVRALDAKFDGVEIHGANGYLIDQFLQNNSNHRTDRYGGSIENRVRFCLEVVDAVISVWGSDRVGIRLSPSGTHGGMGDTDRWPLFSHLVQELNPRKLAYIHLVEPRVDGSTIIEPKFDLGSNRFRPLVTGATRMISAGGHTRETGNEYIKKGYADLIAYGRLFIANPDLPKRFETGAPLNEPHRETFYGGDERGYTNYPSLEEAMVS